MNLLPRFYIERKLSSNTSLSSLLNKIQEIIIISRQLQTRNRIQNVRRRSEVATAAEGASINTKN